MDYNKIILSGRLGADAELKYTNQGYAVLNFSIANSPNYKKKEQVSFFKCALWGKRAESMKDYLTKGTAIIIDGQVVIDKYQKQNGDMAYMTKVNVGDLQFAPTNKPQNHTKWESPDVNSPQARPSPGGWHGERDPEPQSFEDSFEGQIPF